MSRYHFHFIVAALSFAASMLLAADPALHATLSPESVAAGQTADFTLTLNRPLSGPLSVPRLDNGEWINSFSQRTQNINGRSSYSYIIPIRALREGILRVPAFPVKVGDRELQTPELAVKVVAAGEQPVPGDSGDGALTMKEAAFGRIRLVDDRKQYYVGEEIPVMVELFVLPALDARLGSYPELTGIGNAVFRDYSAVNPEQRKFDVPTQTRRILDNRTYVELVFRTAFRPVQSGKITPAGTIQLAIVAPEDRPSRRSRSLPFGGFDDDFFDSFFSGGMARRTPYTVKLEPTPELTILPLPPAPQGVFNLGLIGDWKIECRFDKSEAKVGEPLSLVLTLEGEGSLETLEAPRLTIPGFRIYPAEVEKQPLGIRSRAEVKYALIPLNAGEKQTLLKFATFQPATGEYNIAEFDLKLPVAESDRPLPQVHTTSPLPVDSGAEEAPEPPEPPRDELFYQKAAPGSAVELPLIRNQLGLILFCLIGGPIILIVMELLRLRRRRIANDPEFLRRAALRRRLPELLRTLRGASPEEAGTLIRTEVTPFLAEALGLSRGATAGEVASRVEDPELKQLFEGLENSGFRPDAPGAGTLSPALLDKLCRLLRKLAVFLLLVLAATGLQATDEFNAAFNAGDFAKAVSEYRQRLNPAAPAPNVLYNLGAAYYRSNDLPRAMAAFHQAHLLAPRDSETQENLNLVLRKLARPEIGRTDSPAALLLWCRDRFRPDQYLAVGALAFLVLCIGFGLRHTLRKSTVWTLEGITGLVLVLALAAAISQASGPYNERNVIVTGSAVELRTLPASGTGRIEATIPGGSTGTIVDRRDQWVRLQINGRDGWVPADRVQPLFPGGVF